MTPPVSAAERQSVLSAIAMLRAFRAGQQDDLAALTPRTVHEAQGLVAALCRIAVTVLEHSCDGNDTDIDATLALLQAEFVHQLTNTEE